MDICAEATEEFKCAERLTGLIIFIVIILPKYPRHDAQNLRQFAKIYAQEYQNGKKKIVRNCRGLRVYADL